MIDLIRNNLCCIWLFALCGCAITAAHNKQSQEAYLSKENDEQRTVRKLPWRKDQFEGAWIGTCDVDTIFARVEFKANGNAVLAFCGQGGPVETIFFRSWTVKGGMLQAVQYKRAADASQITGFGDTTRLLLQTDVRGWKRKITMHRESVWEGEFGRLKSKMKFGTPPKGVTH